MPRLTCLLLILSLVPSSLTRGSEDIERLPPVLPLSEELPQDALVDFTPHGLANESGWFARWRADHQRRSAETDTWIQTDRPSFTPADTTVPQGWIQLESGYSFNYDKYSSNGAKYIFTLPELNLRIGLTPWAELRILWNGVQTTETVFKHWSGHKTRITDHLKSNIQMGFKFQVSRQQGLIPTSALITTFIIPSQDGGMLTMDKVWFAGMYSGGLLDYIYSWHVTERISVGGSTGIYLIPISGYKYNQAFQSAILRFHWSPKMSLFFEEYRFWSPSGYSGVDTDPVVDGGVQWRPLQNLQFDWRAGSILKQRQGQHSFFTGVGVSLRY